MIEIPSYIIGHEQVVEAFGYWPGFHDSPICRFEHTPDRIEVDLDVWEMSSEVDARGFFMLQKRHRVGFRFTGILRADLDRFIPENILFALRLSTMTSFADQGWFDVELDSAMGSDAGGSFASTSGEVVQLSRVGD